MIWVLSKFAQLCKVEKWIEKKSLCFVEEWVLQTGGAVGTAGLNTPVNISKYHQK